VLSPDAATDDDLPSTRMLAEAQIVEYLRLLTPTLATAAHC